MISNNKVKKILLVDDEPDITFTIKNMLYNTGFQIYTFNDPITPLKLYRRNFYDLVILEIKIPNMDGFELYIKIKEKDPTVKICFLTAIAIFDEEFRKSRPEVDRIITQECFIQKPITTEDLIKKLRDIINTNMITTSI
ncbi:MAG TPA: response regulator [Nitrososphaeraceae archaeon]|nr:response regulator [Nitrososphaeraceae archaeon]